MNCSNCDGETGTCVCQENLLAQFQGFPKMGRLSRDCTITEKIDGTNGQICIDDRGTMRVGSRTRWLSAESDNFGFFAWARDHEEELRTLGVGRHFGEWWGRGIQRNYGLTERRFSLFNVSRYLVEGEPRVFIPPCVGLVPVLYRGEFDTTLIRCCLNRLGLSGSAAAPGFMDPEGIVIYHEAAGVGFKKTLKNDEKPKSA